MESRAKRYLCLRKNPACFIMTERLKRVKQKTLKTDSSLNPPANSFGMRVKLLSHIQKVNRRVNYFSFPGGGGVRRVEGV
jgi:hypothetical protein